MECYSPKRKNVTCFKKNQIRKSSDDGIMVNRLEKNQIVFEIKKTEKKKSKTTRKSFSEKLAELFYSRIKTFFDFEDKHFADKNA